jgi:hypothetical protein
LDKVEQFQVAWVGEEDTVRSGQIGVAAVDSASSFWSDVIESHLQTEMVTAA